FRAGRSGSIHHHGTASATLCPLRCPPALCPLWWVPGWATREDSPPRHGEHDVVPDVVTSGIVPVVVTSGLGDQGAFTTTARRVPRCARCGDFRHRARCGDFRAGRPGRIHHHGTASTTL
ncbi:MAG: hypothetical protein P8Y94_08430, partial [Acidobacteriota bacterium]